MKNRLASAAAAVGVALVALGGLAPHAAAAELEVYDLAGTAQGIVATTAVRPSIFDPLAQVGSAYAEATLSSQGGGEAASFAAQVYPGKFGMGALGCSGAPLGPWHQAYYPAAGVCKEHEEGALAPPFERFGMGPAPLNDVVNTVLDHTVLKTGFMSTDAHFGEAHSLVRTQNTGLVTEPGGPPVVRAEQVLVTADGVREATSAEHKARSIISNLSLLDGVIKIGSIEAVATTSSDGTTSKATSALTIKDVQVLYENTYHRATIDSRGVHITDPGQSREQNIGASEEFNDALLEAGIRITVGAPSELVDGPSAEASVGGLLLTLQGTVPSMRVPQEVAPVVAQVVKQIPTRCLSDFGAPLPLCFGPGVAPSFGSQVVFSIEVGNAISRTVAFQGFTQPPVDPCTDCGSTPTFPTTPVGPGGPVLIGPGPVEPAPGDGGQQGAQGPPVVTGPLTGLVARLPASALAWAGTAFLILAVGAALAPSLRDA